MELTRTPDVEFPAYTFVPNGFDPTDVEAVKLLAGELQGRAIDTADDLRRWMYDWSEMASAVYGAYARGFTAMNRDTKSEEKKNANLAFMRDVLPMWQTLENELNNALLDSPHLAELDDSFELLLGERRVDRELFREENTALHAEDRALNARYQEIQGGLAVELRGESMTVQQAGARLSDPDRALREEAFRAIYEARAPAAEEIDSIYDKQIELRAQVARNAGYDNFRDFKFKSMHRAYAPQDCETFHAAIAEVVVPAVRECFEHRRNVLGLDPLRPFDADVSLFGARTDVLFDSQERYVDLVQRIFRSIDPIFERDFDVLVRNELLDLMSRPGKSPGGYNCPIEDIRLPFIFFNAVGRREDLRVMLHEGGHAFHTLATRGMPLIDYRRAPTEFCEVASMSMEMFGNERLREVMSDDEAREIEYRQLEGVLGVFLSVARMDAFQHWIYTTDDASAEKRYEKWDELSEVYGTGTVDWSGYEHVRRSQWQRVPHLFGMPFYYVEYAIAQIGALQMWQKEKLDHDGTVVSYRESLALGGSRPLPELFEAAGIRFAMDREILEQVIPPVVDRLRELR
ncbi:MAG: M3 family oligoendopeptidase [Planctomycetota bacterium]